MSKTFYVDLVRFDERVAHRMNFARLDIALRYADETSASYARNDAAAAWSSRPSSGIQAVICSDGSVFNVPMMAQRQAGRLVVAQSIPEPYRAAEALALAFRRRGYSRDGMRV